MKRTFLKISAVGLLAAAIAGLPLSVMAQSTNKTASTNKPAHSQQNSAVKKKAAHPFRGKLAAVDQVTKTIKIGQSTYQITSQTRITKGGVPATLDDAVVGEEAAGYAAPTEDGKMAARSVRFGPKSAATGTAKKKDTTQK